MCNVVFVFNKSSTYIPLQKEEKKSTNLVLVCLIFLIQQSQAKHKRGKGLVTLLTLSFVPTVTLSSAIPMGSKSAADLPLSLTFLLLLLAGFATSDLAQDRAECTDQLVGLATCLPYVGGEAKTPTIDCCTGLKQVLDKSKKCVCILIKDRDDPNLGLKINATLALRLPSTCHTPANLTECVNLLHLKPNSPEAKVFEGFEKSAETTNSTTRATSANATAAAAGRAAAGNGGWGKRWLAVEVVCGILPFVLISHIFVLV